jgi:hypothetical protein
MTVTMTSIEAYEDHKSSGKVGFQAKVIFNAMDKDKNYSRRELSNLTGIELSSICGRVNEMLQLGILIEDDKRPCAVTNKKINPVRKINDN